MHEFDARAAERQTGVRSLSFRTKTSRQIQFAQPIRFGVKRCDFIGQSAPLGQYLNAPFCADHRGLRLGTRLYEDLFAFARREGILHVTCEYNIVPPNEPSRVFHDKFGFHEQGTQWVAAGSKQVSLQMAQT